MSRRRNATPKYRQYRNGAVADVYTDDNRRTTVHFAGAFESEESLAAFAKLLDTLRLNKGKLPPPDGDVDPDAFTVGQLVLRFLKEKAEVEYVDAAGKATAELGVYNQAVKPLVRNFGQDDTTSPPSPEEMAADAGRARRVAVFASIAIYGAMIVVLFDPRIREKAVEAFGVAPLGMPAIVFAGLLQTLLYLPIPRGFYHFALIMEQANRERKQLLGVWAILYVVGIDPSDHYLARSQRICLGTLAYVVAVVVAWIV